MEFQTTVAGKAPVPLMVVGRASKARPAANFHTRCSVVRFIVSTLQHLACGEVGAECDYHGTPRFHMVGEMFWNAKMSFSKRCKSLAPREGIS